MEGTVERIMDELHRAGYGITVDWWSDDSDPRVVIRREMVIVGSGYGPLEKALIEARIMADAS
jgi:hypothetical protein